MSIVAQLFDDLLVSHSFEEWSMNWDSLVELQFPQTPSINLICNTEASLPFNIDLLELELESMNEMVSNSVSRMRGVEDSPQNQLFSSDFSQSLCKSPKKIKARKEQYKEALHADGQFQMVPKNGFVKVRENGVDYFECTWKNCSKRFTRRSTNSNAHWMRHINHRAEFRCRTCSMGFERKGDLKRHANTTHPSNSPNS